MEKERKPLRLPLKKKDDAPRDLTPIVNTEIDTLTPHWGSVTFEPGPPPTDEVEENKS